MQEIGSGVKRLSTLTSSGSAFSGPATSWEGVVGAAAPGLTITSGRVYRMLAVHSGQCVEVPGNSTTNGTEIDQWGCFHTAGWQSFTVERIGASPSFQIRTSGGKCVDLRGWSIVDNGQLVQWSCGATPQANQQFSFDYVSGSGLDLVVQIRNVHSERCLNVAGAGLTEGADLLQIACSGSPPTHRQFIMRLDP